MSRHFNESGEVRADGQPLVAGGSSGLPVTVSEDFVAGQAVIANAQGNAIPLKGRKVFSNPSLMLFGDKQFGKNASGEEVGSVRQVFAHGNYVFVIYHERSTNTARIIAGESSGKGIRWGTAFAIHDSNGYSIGKVAYDPINKLVYIGKAKYQYGFRVYSIKLDTTTLNFSHKTADMDPSKSGSISYAYDFAFCPVRNKMLVVFFDQTPSVNLNARTLTTSGSTMSMGTLTMLASNMPHGISITETLCVGEGRFAVMFVENGALAMRRIELSIPGQLSVSTQSNISSTGVRNVGFAFDDDSKVMLAYEQNNVCLLKFADDGTFTISPWVAYGSSNKYFPFYDKTTKAFMTRSGTGNSPEDWTLETYHPNDDGTAMDQYYTSSKKYNTLTLPETRVCGGSSETGEMFCFYVKDYTLYLDYGFAFYPVDIEGGVHGFVTSDYRAGADVVIESLYGNSPLISVPSSTLSPLSDYLIGYNGDLVKHEDANRLDVAVGVEVFTLTSNTFIANR